ncbi:MAG: 2-hydroxy-3-keto-5-methylthiopentenyl-1-phosphate phosphatase [Ignavibacteriaceae bacterium]
MNRKYQFKIFVDFDGTITKQDVGEQLFLKFGDERRVAAIIENLLEDKISSEQCWKELCEITTVPASSILDEFFNSFGIDETFHHLIDYCNRNNIGLFVLSDGFDYYIKKIFSRENIDLPFFANKLEISGNRLIPSFPYLNENCTESANCKWCHIISNSSDEDYTVYVGDGNSDRHSAQFCDFIFAKTDLLKYCEINRISYFPFNNFQDVIDKLESIRTRKRLKKRHQAILKRREAYRIEY